jgi:glycosyltransferase involved in cell wall biosynthesis
MFCSTIIPTLGRPELARAVNSVLDQTFDCDHFEVIVVNDSGKPLPVAEWQTSHNVSIINTLQRERGVARNTGAAIAQGKYLHFLDDDDWLLPGALESLWKLAQQSNSAFLYGSTQLVDRQGKSILQLHHNMAGNCFIQTIAGEWIPLQSSLINSQAFFEVGGFNPLIPGREDIDLIRRIALRKTFAGTSEIIACVGWGAESSSTDHARASKDALWAREQILDEPATFTRMRNSANNSYWYGRIVRAYLTSAIWNLQRGNGFVAINRAGFAIVAFLGAGRHILSSHFWLAIWGQYVSQTFLAGFENKNSSPT